MLNISGTQSDFKGSHGRVDRLTLRVGESVGFINHRDNKELYGIVIKLNQKTATIQLSTGAKWRVSYNLLFYVMDSNRGIYEIEQVNEALPTY